MKIFPPSPELDWLKDLIARHQDQFVDCGTDNLDLDMLFSVHQFLLWFGRMRKAKPKSKEYLVAYGYTLWHRQAVYRQQLTDAEMESVKMAEIGYQELITKKYG